MGPHRSLEIREPKVARPGLRHQHRGSRGRHLIIDGDMAVVTVVLVAHRDDVACLVNGSIVGNVRNGFIRRTAPPVVVALDVANDMHLGVRAGRHVYVARAGGDAQRHRSVHGKCAVKRPLRGKCSRRERDSHGNQDAGCGFAIQVPWGVHHRCPPFER